MLLEFQRVISSYEILELLDKTFLFMQNCISPYMLCCSCLQRGIHNNWKTFSLRYFAKVAQTENDFEIVINLGDSCGELMTWFPYKISQIVTGPSASAIESVRHM